jgi:hypothetical protein
MTSREPFSQGATVQTQHHYTPPQTFNYLFIHEQLELETLRTENKALKILLMEYKTGIGTNKIYPTPKPFAGDRVQWPRFKLAIQAKLRYSACLFSS